MLQTSVRLKKSDVELMRAAASRVEISQSAFVREAVREKAQKILLTERDEKKSVG